MVTYRKKRKNFRQEWRVSDRDLNPRPERLLTIQSAHLVRSSGSHYVWQSEENLNSEKWELEIASIPVTALHDGGKRNLLGTTYRFLWLLKSCLASELSRDRN